MLENMVGISGYCLLRRHQTRPGIGVKIQLHFHLAGQQTLEVEARPQTLFDHVVKQPASRFSPLPLLEPKFALVDLDDDRDLEALALLMIGDAHLLHLPHLDARAG